MAGFRRMVALLALAAATPGNAAVQLTPAQQQAEVEQVGAAVAQFHAQFNAGDYAAIWQNAGPLLQQGATQADFVALMAGYRAKVGDYQSHTLIGDVVTDTSMNAVTISYSVTFAKGTAKESFVYVMTNGAPQLAHFEIEDIATSGS